MSTWTREREEALVLALIELGDGDVLSEVESLIRELARLREESALANWFVHLEPGSRVVIRWGQGQRIEEVRSVSGGPSAYTKWVFAGNDSYTFSNGRCISNEQGSEILPLTPELRSEIWEEERRRRFGDGS